MAGDYLMGHTERERRRLAQQAAALNPLTAALLERAGLTAGMRVLDLGCGLGDVTLLAAQRVGAAGSVTGIDIDPAALARATERASAAGLAQVRFVCSALDTYEPEDALDAVLGRHILIHTADPAAVLARVHALLPAGGLVAFQEYDFATLAPSYPATPLWDEVRRAYREFFSRATRADMGLRLPGLLAAAGFAEPQARIEAPLGFGSEGAFAEAAAEAYRSLQLRAPALGLKLDLDPQGLAERLRADAQAAGAAVSWPFMVSAWARRPR